MRIAILTSRTAKPIIESVLGRYKPPTGVEIVVVDLPVPAIGVVPVSGLARLFQRVAGERGIKADIVVIPGLSPGDVTEFQDITGLPAVRGPRDPGYLPHAIDLIARGRLRPGESYEDKAEAPVLALEKPQTAFYIDGLPVPERGPPILLFTEVSASVPVELFAETVERVSREGADAVIVGSRRGAPPEEVAARARTALETARAPVICEPGSPGNVQRLVESGCEGFTLSAEAFARAIDRSGPGLRDMVWIVGDRDISSLARASILARRRGIERLMLDPVVGLPLIDLSETPSRYREAAGLGRPLLFSAANALTEMSADPHGAQLLLASLAVELGASAYLVVEDGWPTKHSTAEAFHALRLASSSHISGTTPRSPASRLYVVRQEVPPPPPPVSARDEIFVEGYVPPRMDPGYFKIFADHNRRLIIVEYAGPTGTSRWAGSDPRGLVRTVLRSVDVSREHAAYLGIEVYKAWLALRMGKTYLQDEDILRLPWEGVD